MQNTEGTSISEERGVRPAAGRWAVLSLASLLGLAVVSWEYLLNAVMNPQVDWNLLGAGAHLGLDLVLVVPLAILAIGGGFALARRLGFGGGDLAAFLGTVGVVTLLFAGLMLPLASARDLAHEWMGNRYGLALAEVQTTVVSSDLTVQESTQLCSFGSLRNPSLARSNYQELTTTVIQRVSAGAADVLVQLAAFLPLLFGGLFLRSRRRLPRERMASALRWLRPWLRPARLGLFALGGSVLFCVGYGLDQPAASIAHAQMGGGFNACTDGGEVKEYNVSAIDVEITLNRYGDFVDGYMYTLDANIDAVNEFAADLRADRMEPEGLNVARVSHGLRKDVIQPLVIRANLGDCLRINFTNRLDDGQPASMHILGLAHTAANASSAVGVNVDTFAGESETVTYEIPMPLDPEAERAYYFHDHGAGRRRQNKGLFGAIVAEPRGSTYLDVETGEPLNTQTGSNWEAIIVDPNLDGRPDGKSFREFVIFYHEIGDEAFTNIRAKDDKAVPLIDELAGVYRPGARALNYRSEPFRRRLQIEKTGKSLGYSSYPFGDPATPIPRSYLGEGTKTRLMHGGSEVFHVHHLHGGGDRWRRNPNADPNNDYWKGLTKVPNPNLTSIHLDSQSIGPGTSYNLEHECGAGGCQQGVGEFLYHCHIGHHYISGMWAFWRVFGTTQTAETNVNGRPLAVVPELFQNPDNELIPPSVPQGGVSAGDLLGLVVDDGRTIVADADVSNPATQIGVQDWIERQLPPAGVPFDKFDATVWNWTSTGAGGGLRVFGAPESTEAFEGYVSATPGVRPEVLFNPKNGRYTWPLFRPQRAQRPPFTPRHTGAPWLGEDMKEGRLDGLCAANGVDPSVDIGNVVKRFYPVSSIALPISVTPDRVDRDGQIFVLNEEEDAIRSGQKAAQPLAIRSNVGDCVEILLTNKIPDGLLNKNFSKTNIHSHFVQFDTQASDGVITGYSFEQSVRPYELEDRRLTSAASAGSTVLNVNHTNGLRPGIWLGIGLGEGTCGVNAQGQPERCTEIRQIAGMTANTITLDEPLSKDHGSGEAAGVEFVRYNWYPDVNFGTVFFHTHVEFKDWDHGLFGAHIVEPKGSSYHDPQTGDVVRAGTLVDIRVDPAAGGHPAAHGVDGSFREFMLFLHNNNPVEGPFSLGGGTINLRAEPWNRRLGEAAYRFSSVTHGDPFTPQVRAYVGDPIVVRGMGLVERVGGIRFTGHRFNMELNTDKSDLRDTTYIGISERFDVSLDGGAGGPAGLPGDYLYYSTLGRDFEAGAWGLLRVHDTSQGDLIPLPDRPAPPGGAGFPQLAEDTGEAPPSLNDGPGDVCPPGAPVRQYSVSVADANIFFNDFSRPEDEGVVYRLQGTGGPEARTPLVLRANAGDCLEIALDNDRDEVSSISLGEVAFDPQRSYGSAVGLNFDSNVAPGASRTYRYYADKELGIVVALNLGDVDSIEHGAFGAVIVEPEGSSYFRAGSNQALPGGGAGVQADIVTDGVTTREFVALFSDQDRRIGQNAMPYPPDVEFFNGINYSAEPLRFRGMKSAPSQVFNSNLWGDPRHVVQVPAGTPLTYRVALPWGNQIHVPTLEGHRWRQEPGMPGSEQVYNDVLAPGMGLNLHFVGGAGGDIGASADFLFLDRRQPFLEGGMWNILRVTEPGGASGHPDSIFVFYAALEEEDGDTMLGIHGVNSIRPAGDFAPTVTVYEGGMSGGVCTGAQIATVQVEDGSGVWDLEQVVASAPTEICVTSPGGGVTTQPVFGP